MEKYFNGVGRFEAFKARLYQVEDDIFRISNELSALLFGIADALINNKNARMVKIAQIVPRKG